MRHISTLINGHLRRRGHLDSCGALLDESVDELDELGTHHAAAVQGLIPFGARAGQPANLFGEAPERLPPRPRKRLCADHDGYSLHAAVRIGHRAGEHRSTRASRALRRQASHGPGEVVHRSRWQRHLPVP